MLNRFEAIGNLGRDPEMRYTPTGKAVTNFSVAVNRKYTRSDGEQVDETLWVNVSTWGNLAEVTKQYLRKGSKVYFEGRLGEPFVYENGEGASNQVTATSVIFLDSRNGDTDRGEAFERPKPKKTANERIEEEGFIF